jgi:hypothetical protein
MTHLATIAPLPQPPRPSLRDRRRDEDAQRRTTLFQRVAWRVMLRGQAKRAS